MWSQPGAIEWAARVFAAGRSPDWDELPEDSLPGVFEHDTHDCRRFDIADTLDSLGAEARSMAAFAESLTPEEQVVVAVYAEEWVVNTTAVIRHALHDAEHRLLEVRRGVGAGVALGHTPWAIIRGMVNVGTARFSGPERATVDVVAAGAHTWCASVLKPLYFWAAAGVAPFANDRRRWRALAEPAIAASANDPTTEVWETAGAEALLVEVRRLTGVGFPAPDQVGHPWGRVRVTAGQLARAYAALLSDRSDVAAELRGFLRSVPDEQTFGVRAAYAAAVDVPAADVMVKSGWFSAPEETVIRTHTVVMHGGPCGYRGVAVTTAVESSPADRAAYAATYVHGPEVLPIHTAVAGHLLVAAVAELAPW